MRAGTYFALVAAHGVFYNTRGFLEVIRVELELTKRTGHRYSAGHLGLSARLLLNLCSTGTVRSKHERVKLTRSVSRDVDRHIRLARSPSKTC